MADSYICTVCNKRGGPTVEGTEIILSRCEKHKNTLSTAEIYDRGLTVGQYNARERLRQIKNREK